MDCFVSPCGLPRKDGRKADCFGDKSPRKDGKAGIIIARFCVAKPRKDETGRFYVSIDCHAKPSACLAMTAIGRLFLLDCHDFNRLNSCND